MIRAKTEYLPCRRNTDCDECGGLGNWWCLKGFVYCDMCLGLNLWRMKFLKMKGNPTIHREVINRFAKKLGYEPIRKRGTATFIEHERRRNKIKRVHLIRQGASYIEQIKTSKTINDLTNKLVELKN